LFEAAPRNKRDTNEHHEGDSTDQRTTPVPVKPLHTDNPVNYDDLL
jgi:hypothetical protein